MKTISRYIMTLALLITAVTGARAAWTGGTYTATANENLGAITVNGDATLTINSGVTVTVTGGINIASGTLTVTGPGTLVVTGAKGNNGASGWNGGNGGNGGVAISGNIIVQGGATVTANGGSAGSGGSGEQEGGKGGNGGNAFAGTLTYKSGTVTACGGSGGSGGWGEEECASSGSAGKAFANDVDFTQTTGYSVTNGTSTIGSVLNQPMVVISGGTPVGPEVTINDDKTEASFTMPAFDATADYELVRDMQDEANPVAFSGLPSSGNIIVKKGDDGKYQPAEALTIQLIDPLAAAEAQNIIAADGITIKVLVGNGGTPIEYDQENPITLADFLADMKPGYYWIKAESTDENSPYDGTVYSSQFTVVEQYDLTVKPANDFSKGKVESVTVGGQSVTIDATTGEAAKTGIDPDTEVKLKAKRGYIIEKVEAKKTSTPN